MRRAAGGLALALLAAGCSSHSGGSSQRSADTKPAPREETRLTSPLPRRVSVLGLPPVDSKLVPGYLLIADRDNNRALIVSPAKKIVWQDTALRGPDDAFFTPGYRSVITNEEFNDTLVEVSLRGKRRVWSYGHGGVPGSGPGYLDTPDDAYRLRSGITTVADIRNCRIVELDRAKRVVRVLGGSCVHDPPRGFASPNGDTPLPDGGLLVTEIGGWIDRLGPSGNLLWSIRSPVPYPSDAQLLRNGQVLVASFAIPGRIVILDRRGVIVWSFGSGNGPNRLAKPSLAVRWPNGLIASNDDYNHRVIVIDPRTKSIVWQYGHTGVPGRGPGYLNKPDGLDLLPASDLVRVPAAGPAHRQPLRVHVTRIGSLPQPISRLAAVALPGGRLLALGGLVGGSSSNQVLLGSPRHLHAVAGLPVPTHDAAAALVGGSAYLFGGGQVASTDAVVRISPVTGEASGAGTLGEPLSDLGATTIDGRAYIVGGYTGTRFATAVLRFRSGRLPVVVARLPAGLRYAAVAALGGKIYVAGGLTASGDSRAVLAVDPSAGTVTRVATLPKPLAHVAMGALGSRLLLVGGGSRRVLTIDPRAGTVVDAGRLPQALADPAAVSQRRRVLVLGGGSDTVFALR